MKRNIRPAISVVDGAGLILFANRERGEIVGLGDLQGTNWRDHVSKARLVIEEPQFQRALQGEPMSTLRQLMHSDGSRIWALLQTESITRPDGSVVLLGTTTVLREPVDLHDKKAFDTASYVGQLADQLARMAVSVGLTNISLRLGGVAEHAGELAEQLLAKSRASG